MEVVRNMEICDLRRGQWATGRIHKVYPGDDGLARVVDVELDKNNLQPQNPAHVSPAAALNRRAQRAAGIGGECS